MTLVDVISTAQRLLTTLEPDQRPEGALQMMSAGQPFEPNPMVPTLVHGLDEAEAWERLAEKLGRGLLAEQPLFVLSADARPQQATIASLGRSAPAGEALFIPAVPPESAERSLQGLRQLVHRLRAPGGCPWDREQTPQSLVRFVIEEAYEVADAIRYEGSTQLAEELGDLLLQVFLQAEIAEEGGDFSLNDVVQRISTKLIRRHPHVFGDVEAASASDVQRNWERLKSAEGKGRTSALDGLPRSLPALLAAQKIQRQFKKAGFDWPDHRGVDEKLADELSELRHTSSPDRAAAELGDVLFILARLAVDLDVDAEDALRAANARLAARFRFVEERARERGHSVEEVPLEELLSLWNQAKSAEPMKEDRRPTKDH